MLYGGDFIEEKALAIREGGSGKDQDQSRSVESGLVPIENGIIIDHLAEGQAIEQIWGLMHMVRTVLSLHQVGGQGVFRSKANPEKANGIILVPDFDVEEWDRVPLKKLAAMAPGSTLNVIKDGLIVKKYILKVPPRIYNFADTSCKNPACISHPANMQHEVSAYFLRAENRSEEVRMNTGYAFSCKYCEAMYGFWQIWDYKGGLPI